MLASRVRYIARDLVTRAIAAPMAALASVPALDPVAAPARDRARGGGVRDGLREAWSPRVSPRDGSERAGWASPSAHARFPDIRAVPSAPRWPRRHAPFKPWRVDPAPPRGLTVRELQAQLRSAESARARGVPEYGGDFSGEDEDAVLADALGAAIRAIALEDGSAGHGPSSVRTPAAADGEAAADAVEALFLRVAAAPRRGAAAAVFPGFANPETSSGFAAASVKLKRVKKMNKHKHRKRRKRDRNKTK